MKPSVPKLRIGPFDYKVRYDDDAMEAAAMNGACLPDQLTILLSSRNARGMERETLLHESLHAVWKQTYLARDYPDDEQTSTGEGIISELAPRLLALLRDNPRLVEFLCG